MGEIKLTIEVGNNQGDTFEPVEVTVDTGSTCSQIPTEV